MLSKIGIIAEVLLIFGTVFGMITIRKLNGKKGIFRLNIGVFVSNEWGYSNKVVMLIQHMAKVDAE